MPTFDDRDRTFENKFAHDKELQFKTNARRNKLLGLWAAAKLDKSGPEAEAYAKEVVMADLEEPGDDEVLQKVHADLSKAGIAISPQEVRREMNRLMDEARRQMASEIR